MATFAFGKFLKTMYRIGKYRADDRMCDLVSARYAVLLVMSRFGIAPGFGDRTIGEVCRDAGVDCATFLAVVNLPVSGAETEACDPASVSVAALTDYLHRSHGYFLDYRLPAIRTRLAEAVACAGCDLSVAILRFFDEYVSEVHRHMAYEEANLFPYVRSLLEGGRTGRYSAEVFSRHHDRIEAKLTELKNILIKYYPAGRANELNDVLFDIFLCEEDLASHNAVEDRIYVPAIRRLEKGGGR